MRKRTWSDNDLRDAVKSSTSLRQVVLKLCLRPSGGNYTQIKGSIERLCLDTAHFKGQGWSRGLVGFVSKRKIPLAEILVPNSTYQSYKLRNRLFKEGLMKNECEECGWSEAAEDGRIPLELHHKNGVGDDNRFINLQILCPNCHSLKPNHRGKNTKKHAGML